MILRTMIRTMTRTATLLLLILGCISQTAGAQTDSLLVVKADWQSQKIAPGVRLKQHQFSNLFQAPQYVSILEIKARRKNKLDLGAEVQQLKSTSTFGQQAGALAALNGTFFDVKHGGSVDYIRADGREVNASRLGKSGQRAANQRAAVVIAKGKLQIAKWDGSDNWESRLEGEDVMVSGPLLRLDNQNQALDSSAFNRSRHPRTLVAVGKRNRVLLITVDGRHANAAGMSMPELARLSRWLQARSAINLDGGGSTTLWVSGQPEGGVVNHPSDNKKWDHAGERKVANVLLLRRR
ncbi:MAG: phosphodiester glycosidase family protein [Adhaeribacter sp.]